MATKRAAEKVVRYADPTKYHYIEGQTPFWRKFRELFTVNPEISSGLPLPNENRYPQPGSRLESHANPPSKASDLANNPYWKRDFRRSYPRLEVISQQHLTQLLLAQPEGQAQIGDGSQAPEGQTAVATVDTSSPSAFTEALVAAHSGDKAYSTSRLPPTPPFKTWKAKVVPDAVPHGEHQYWPMKSYV